MAKISQKNLQAAMIDKCIGILELAKRAGLQPAIVGRLLKKNSNVHLPTLAKISKALDVPADDLILKE